MLHPFSAVSLNDSLSQKPKQSTKQCDLDPGSLLATPTDYPTATTTTTNPLSRPTVTGDTRRVPRPSPRPARHSPGSSLSLTASALSSFVDRVLVSLRPSRTLNFIPSPPFHSLLYSTLLYSPPNLPPLPFLLLPSSLPSSTPSAKALQALVTIPVIWQRCFQPNTPKVELVTIHSPPLVYIRTNITKLHSPIGMDNYHCHIRSSKQFMCQKVCNNSM